jgi:hypothetical protein
MPSPSEFLYNDDTWTATFRLIAVEEKPKRMIGSISESKAVYRAAGKQGMSSRRTGS